MDWILTLWAAHKAYLMAQKTGTGYVAITQRGVPYIACFLGIGREAWRVSQRAIEEFELTRR